MSSNAAIKQKGWLYDEENNRYFSLFIGIGNYKNWSGGVSPDILQFHFRILSR